MNKQQKLLLEKTFNLIVKYIETLQNNDGVINYQPPGTLIQKFDLKIGEDKSSEDAILKSIENYLKYSVRTGNVQFFNQLNAGFNFPAFLGDVITSLTNTSMYTYEVAPVATLMELELIEKMCSFVGFNDGEGTFTTGGSNSNLLAMLCARNRKIESAKNTGITGEKKLTIFVSDQSHYSFEKGANLLGIGINNVIKVTTIPAITGFLTKPLAIYELHKPPVILFTVLLSEYEAIYIIHYTFFS